MTIDMHAHYLPPDLVDMLRKRTQPPHIKQTSPSAETLYRHYTSYHFDPLYGDISKRLDLLDKTGVETQIISLPGLMGIDSLPVEESAPLVRMFNEALCDLCRRHPGRFIGLAALPMADIELAAEELRRSVQTLGLVGAILPINFFTTLSDAQKLAPLFDIAEQSGLHFFIHPGWRPDEVPSPDNQRKPSSRWKGAMPMGVLELQTQITRAAITLLYSDFLGSYPHVSIHVANLGGTYPFLVERMDQISKIRFPDEAVLSAQAHRIYVDCASFGPRAVEMAVAAFGSDNILFGSDTPTFKIDSSLNAIRNANITDDDRSRILSQNAEMLLRLPRRHR